MNRFEEFFDTYRKAENRALELERRYELENIKIIYDHNIRKYIVRYEEDEL